MILGTGVDIIEISRIEGVLDRHGDRFLNRVFIQDELKDYREGSQRSVQQLAGRFAAKEAFMKALGTGLTQGVSWRDISVLSKPTGAPYLKLTGRADELAGLRQVKATHVSISHSREYAVAMVVLEQ